MRLKLQVNGAKREAEAREHESLLTVLRERLGLWGSKNACEQGECGSCSVLLDGTLVCACLVLAAQADGHEILTVEGLGSDEMLHPVQEAFAATGAVQCGFCTGGMVMSVRDLLARNPKPSVNEIKAGKVEGLKQIYCLFARLAEPLDYKAIDARPVDLVFLLLSPPDAGAEHLKALAAISRVTRHGATLEKMRGARTRDALAAVLMGADERDAA